MNDRAAFHEAIRENPDDPTLRLVFADWLEEQGDPQAEFIRLQCELEALPDRYGERGQELQRRERDMLEKHSHDWLGPLAELDRATNWMFRTIFRRGLVETIHVPAQVLLDRAADLERWCPVVQEVAIHSLRDGCQLLAELPLLSKFRRLELADWIAAADARALAGSPYLANLHRLTLWLGGQHEAARCQAFARATTTRNLKELRLIQLHGGLTAGPDADRLNIQADERADLLNQLRGEPVAQVYRPFQQTFPIRGDTGRELYAGRLPDQRQALAALWAGHTLILVVFDAEGNLVDVQERPQVPFLTRERDQLFWTLSQDELYDYLRNEFGFQVDLVRVKEFAVPEGLSVHYWGVMHDEFVADPDRLPDTVLPEEREVYTVWVHQWMARGDFVIEWGNDYWAGPDGIIHSS